MRNTYKHYERLKKQQHIDTLFRNGKAFSVSSLRFIYHKVAKDETETSPVRAGFSVPKKKFRKAVHRNRVRRLLREAWRLNKSELYATVPATMQLHLFLVFNGEEIPDYNMVNEAMVKGIQKLKELLAA